MMAVSKEELAAFIHKARYWKRRYEDGAVSVGENTSDEIADAILAEYELYRKPALITDEAYARAWYEKNAPGARPWEALPEDAQQELIRYAKVRREMAQNGEWN